MSAYCAACGKTVPTGTDGIHLCDAPAPAPAIESPTALAVRILTNENESLWKLAKERLDQIDALTATLAERDEDMKFAVQREGEKWMSIAAELERKLAAAEAERDAARAQSREAAQMIIGELGAPGPESLLETTWRAVAEIKTLRMIIDSRDLRDRLALKVKP